MRLPPVPKWNSALDDIDVESLFAAGRQQEASLMPSGITYPRTRQIWEAMRDCEVGFVTLFKPNMPTELDWSRLKPFGQVRLSQAERVRVLSAEASKPLHVSFQPLRYEELHAYIVPTEIRSLDHYSQYFLSLRTAPTQQWLHEVSEFFTEIFRLIEDVV